MPVVAPTRPGALSYTGEVEGTRDANRWPFPASRPHQALRAEAVAARPAVGGGPLKRVPSAGVLSIHPVPATSEETTEHAHRVLIDQQVMVLD